MERLPMYMKPEEKLNVFWQKYQNMTIPPNQSSIYDLEPYGYHNQDNKSNVDDNAVVETKEIQFTFPEEFDVEDQKLYSSVLNKDVTNTPVKNKNLPDLQTMTSNFFRNTQKISPSKIVEEINSLNHISESDKKYLILLQHLESRGNPTVENRFGYAGLYQFGKSALEAVKMSKEDYLNSTTNQHIAALKLMELNLKSLNKYIGKTVRGITFTKYNLAAAQHLLGAKNVKNFIESNGETISVDGNNLPITAYMIRFQHIK